MLGSFKQILSVHSCWSVNTGISFATYIFVLSGNCSSGSSSQMRWHHIHLRFLMGRVNIATINFSVFINNLQVFDPGLLCRHNRLNIVHVLKLLTSWINTGFRGLSCEVPGHICDLLVATIIITEHCSLDFFIWERIYWMLRWIKFSGSRVVDYRPIILQNGVSYRFVCLEYFLDVESISVEIITFIELWNEAQVLLICVKHLLILVWSVIFLPATDVHSYLALIFCVFVCFI